MWQELRFAARKLIRQPGFSSAVIILIALGVGAGTAVFTVVNALLLTPPALIREPERVVRLNAAEQGSCCGIATYPDYVEVRDQARVFTQLFGYDGAATTVQLRSHERLAEADARFVTGNYFEGLGVPTLAGRLLVVNDDHEQAQNVLVISESLQRRWFASARAALGSTLQVNGQTFSIVGVAPMPFRGAAWDDAPVDLWLPMWKRPLVTGRPRLDMERTPGYVHAFMNTMGRLRPGVSLAQAQANLDAIIIPMMQAQETSEGLRVALSSAFGLSPTRRATIITITRLIGALAVIVLLIVCANLANLTLARAVARRGEVTVKLALGAGRWRLIRQVGIETGLLALAGGVVGLACAFWAARGLAAFLPFELAAAPTPNLRVYTFALLLAALTALACALAPALLTTRTSAAHTAGARTLGGGAAARTALVIAQVALCFVLLSGAALFVRTLSRIHAVPLGFNPQNVLALTFDLRAHGYNEQTAPLMYDRMAERMRMLPGVQSVALGSIVPLSGARRTSSVEIEGRPVNPAPRLVLDNNAVSPGYFRTLQTPLLSGRDFTTADAAQAPQVTLINQTMAKRYWPNQNPIGKRFRRGDGVWIEVIGVVADTRTLDVTEPPVPTFYRAFAQAFFPRMVVYVRTAGDAARLMDPARRAVAELDSNIVPRSVNTLERVHAAAIRSYTTNARLVSVLGFIALLLAALGLYAVTSYLVTQRTREFGLRLAIGARPADLLKHVLGGALQRTALGIVIGVLGSVALVQLTERFLFELSPTDPQAFIAAALLLGASVTLASWLPARRATRVDPVVALRAD